MIGVVRRGGGAGGGGDENCAIRGLKATLAITLRCPAYPAQRRRLVGRSAGFSVRYRVSGWSRFSLTLDHPET